MNIQADKHKKVLLDPVDHLYERLKYAETGTVDPKLLDEDGLYWRRTLGPEDARGSTAFGPVQMTSSLIEGAANDERYGLDQDEMRYARGFFGRQGQLFNLHGVNKFLGNEKPDFYNPQFDYAGAGDGSGYMASPEHLKVWGGKEKVKEMYERIAKKIIKFSLDKHSGDFTKAAEEWRGKAKNQDVAYFERGEFGQV